MGGNQTWPARARRAAPYAAAFLAVLILLLIGYLRGPARDQRPSADARSATPSATPVVPATSPRPSPTRTATATSTATSPPVTRTPGPRTGGTTTVFAWIRDFGLEGGGDSDMETWVGLLSRGECAELLRSVDRPEGGFAPHTDDVFRAAAQACLAAFDARTALWAAAERAVAELAGRAAGFDCVNRSVYELTRTLLRVHREHPTAILRRGGRSDADSLDCPRLRSVRPSTGPAAGGYPVVLSGEHLPDPAVVHFGERILTVRTTGGRTAVLTVPPMGADAGVSVWVDGWPWGPTQTATFDYERAPGSPSDGP
jgi:IPT/TIG domain-containing protein